MTALVCYGKTRLLARFERGLNNASRAELLLLLGSLERGVTFIQVMEAQWKLGQRTVSGRADQNHLANHAFGGKNGPWWGPDVDFVASEGLAQTVRRMVYDLEGRPRRAAKRVDMWWMCGPSDHFHVVTAESDQQVTMTWMTPPKPDQGQHFEDYKQRVANLGKGDHSFDRNLVLPDNFTREEDLFVTAAKSWSVTHGVDTAGKRRACAIVWKSLTPHKNVRVTRALCENFSDRFPEDKSRGKSGRGKKAT